MESVARIASVVKILLAIYIAVWSYESVKAQDLYDYRYYKLFESTEDYAEPKSDSVQNVAPQIRRELDTHLFDYNFSHIRFMRRGESYTDRSTLFHGVAVNGIYKSNSWRLGLEATPSQGVSVSQRYGSNRGSQLEVEVDTLADERQRINVSFSSRNAPFGLSYSGTFRSGKRWLMAADVRAKTGRDMHIDGLFANQATVNFMAHCTIDSLQSVSLLFSMSPTQRSTRQSSVGEVYDLTGNNLYNPAWGYQNGKVRNAHIRRNVVPMAAVAYQRRINKAWSVEAAVAMRMGIERYSVMDYLNAQTPRPDNYRYLPSYFEDYDIVDALTMAWQQNNTQYTQIDFDELIARNRLQGGNSVYVIADRASRITHFEANGAATHRSGNHTFTAGLNLIFDRRRDYKQMRDLLGGEQIVDIDYFLVDDDAFSNALQNDLNNPNRIIRVGDRYGYDFALSQRKVMLYGRYDYRNEHISAQVAMRVGYEDWQRRGFYRKELFADNSYGKSALLTSAPFSISAAFDYRLSGKHTIDFGLSYAKSSAQGENLFIQPQYNNRAVTQPKNEQLLRANASHNFNSEKLVLRTTIFARLLLNAMESSTLYDDVSAQYSDVITERINTLAFGAEVELRWHISSNWRISAAASAMSYRYTSNPLVTIYADRDNYLIADKIESYSKGLRVGNAPQLAAAAEVRYYNRGWGVSLDANYAGLRYIAPSFTRRTQRTAYQASSPEIFDEFINQQRLNDAFTLDLSLSKTIWLSRYDKRTYKTQFSNRFIDKHPRSRITIYLSVQNLLGSKDIVYSGYESSRMWRQTVAGTPMYRPQASRYLYAYPRTYYASVTFTF